MYYSVVWHIKQDGNLLPPLFVRKKDAVAYAIENNLTNYEIVRDSER